MEVANAVGTWLGLALTVAGFGLAYWQLRKATSAIEATRAATAATERRVATNRLQDLLLRLTLIRWGLESAVDHDDPEATKQQLREWIEFASQVSPALAGAAVPSSADELRHFINRLRESISHANTTRAKLGTVPPVAAKTVRVRAAVAVAADLANEIKTAMAMYTGADHGKQ